MLCLQLCSSVVDSSLSGWPELTWAWRAAASLVQECVGVVSTLALMTFLFFTANKTVTLHLYSYASTQNNLEWSTVSCIYHLRCI